MSTHLALAAAGKQDSNEALMIAVSVLTLIVVFLVVYLFYAVINPERF